MKVILFSVILFFMASVSQAEVGMLKPITDGIVATVSGEIIFKSDLSNYIGSAYEDSALQYAIEMKTLYVLGKEQGLIAEDNEVEQYLSQSLAQQKKYYGGESLFKEALRQQGYTFDNFIKKSKEDIKQSIIALKMRQRTTARLRANVIISRNQVIDYFNAHKSAMSHPEQRRVSHILIEINDKRSKLQAKKYIDAIYKKIKSGLSFDSAAKEYSEAPTAANGGDIGFITRGTIMRAVENVAFSLKKGEVSKPFPTSIGYQMVYISDIIPGKIYDIKNAAVFKKIREIFIDSLIQNDYYNWLKKEENKLDIEILKG